MTVQTPLEGIVRKLLGLFIVCFGLLVGASGASAATITVNGTADSAANEGTCSLREAISSANNDSPSGGAAGECAAGSGADTIAFDAAVFTGNAATSTITTTGLPPITQPTTVAGGNCGSPKPCVGLDPNGQGGLTFNAANSAVSGIAIFDASGVSSVAIFGPEAPGFVVRNIWLGMTLNQTAAQNQNGMVILGDGAVIGGTGANDRNVIAMNANVAVKITGANDVSVQGNYFGTKADGTTTATVGNFHAIQVVGDTGTGALPPVGTLIGGPEAGVPGTCEAPCNVIANDTSTGIDLDGGGGTLLPAGRTAIEGNFIGLNVSGALVGTGDSAFVGGADDVTVGGDVSRRNYLTEVKTLTGASSLDVVANFFGLNPAGTTRLGQGGTIIIGAAGTPISGATVTGNRIARDTAGGSAVQLSTNGAVVQGNTIGIGTGGQNVGGGGVGIVLNNGSANQVGGSGAGEGNVVGNAGAGISINDNGGTVAGNVIGTDVTQTQSHPVSNAGIGVGGDNHVIGGTTAAAENVIANVTAGDAIDVAVDGTDFNTILRNRGTASAGQEFIELRSPFGPGNGPTGPNNGIERPTITAGATSQQVSGAGALPGATVRVYRTASTAGGTGPRDVIAYAGQAIANGSGNWTLSCPSAGCEVGLPGAGQVTANQTATNGDSSEMADPKAYTDQPPETTITSGPADGSTAGSGPQFAFSSSEPNSTFACNVDGGGFSSCTSPRTLGPLREGQHTFAVRATDNTANEDSTPASRTFTVDATPPDTQIDSGPAEGATTTDSTPSFGFSATEVGSSFECRVDGDAFAVCTSEHTTAALVDGQHTFEVRATDASGNADGSPASRTFTVDAVSDTPPDPGPGPGPGPDRTPPQTTIDQQPKDKLKAGKSAGYAFSSSEAGSTFRCSIDGKPQAPCASPLTLTKLKKGTHTFEVVAVDAAGNADPTPATDTFKVKKKERKRRHH
jgi:CSLREA domain-containing protein